MSETFIFNVAQNLQLQLLIVLHTLAANKTHMVICLALDRWSSLILIVLSQNWI